MDKKAKAIKPQSEQQKMLSLLGNILVQSDKKNNVNQRKRDHKLKAKLNGNKDIKKQIEEKQPQTMSMGSLSGTMVDSIFNPPSSAFKGETPFLSIDCEMV
jgi:hydroxymethylglutaryl-CoA reductase